MKYKLKDGVTLSERDGWLCLETADAVTVWPFTRIENVEHFIEPIKPLPSKLPVGSVVRTTTGFVAFRTDYGWVFCDGSGDGFRQSTSHDADRFDDYPVDIEVLYNPKEN